MTKAKQEKQTQIKVEFDYTLKKVSTSYKDDYGIKRNIDEIRFTDVSKRRAYFMGRNEGLNRKTIAKQIQINQEDKEVYVMFGKEKIVIGTLV